jgi:uncharacterized protein
MIRVYFLLLVVFVGMGLLACKGKSAHPVMQAHVSDTFPTTFFIPAAQGRVNDFDSLFTQQQRVSLDSMLGKYDTAQIVVATVDSSYFAPGDIEEFSLRLFNTWGIGDSTTHNGILICICLDYRQLRIQNGLGIENIITNEETKRIIDTAILPRFKEGKFYEGVISGITGLKEIIRQKNR